MWKFFSFLTKSSAGGSSKCAVGRRSEIELNIWQITFIKSAWELEKEKTIQELLKFEDQSTGEWKEKCSFIYIYMHGDSTNGYSKLSHWRTVGVLTNFTFVIHICKHVEKNLSKIEAHFALMSPCLCFRSRKVMPF